MIFVHSYYAQPIYYAYVSLYCESLADWGIPLIVNLRGCDSFTHSGLTLRNAKLALRMSYACSVGTGFIESSKCVSWSSERESGFGITGREKEMAACRIGWITKITGMENILTTK